MAKKIKIRKVSKEQAKEEIKKIYKDLHELNVFVDDTKK